MQNKYNWKEKRDKNAYLLLEDGTIFRGISIGAKVDTIAECVFNTGLSGYQEILSDPSYSGQIIVMTYPEIGNYGISFEDFESNKSHCSGFICHKINQASSWRSDQELSDYLIKENIPALAEIDTRALTLLLREKGSLKGFICTSDTISIQDAKDKISNWQDINTEDYALKASCQETYSWGEHKEENLNCVVYDFGVKHNILRMLEQEGFNVTVVNAKYPAKNILEENYNCVMFSNGPGNPTLLDYAINNAKELLGKIPIMGICLGHQILSLACSCEIIKLKFGHHGNNHPIKNINENTIEITSQNHNYAVDKESINEEVLSISHINLNDQTIAGLKHKEFPMMSIQYHPEAGPGPHDSRYLFKEFKQLVLENTK